MTALRNTLWEIVKFVVTILVIVLPIRYYIAQPFIVSGQSMYPTFDDREYLIVDELSYHLRLPERGEVIIFKYPGDPSKYYIKRIIGLPGETIVVKNNDVFIKTSGQLEKIEEPYLPAIRPYWADTELTLAADQYFVMGDNRPASSDSRSWGALPKENITGRALLRLYPFDRVSLLPGIIKDN